MGIKELSSWIEVNNTVPYLSIRVKQALLKWKNPLLDLETPTLSDLYQDLIDNQSIIGWDKALFGLIHNSWIVAQDNHLKSLDRKSSGSSWISTSIRKL